MTNLLLKCGEMQQGQIVVYYQLIDVHLVALYEQVHRSCQAFFHSNLQRRLVVSGNCCRVRTRHDEYLGGRALNCDANSYSSHTSAYLSNPLRFRHKGQTQRRVPKLVFAYRCVDTKRQQF